MLKSSAKIKTLLIALIVFAFPARLALAADSTSALQLQKTEFKFENDFFAQQDRYYTVGMEISALFKLTHSGSSLLRLPFADNGMKQHYASFSIAQQIFTPLDQKSTKVVEDDRPYAGWLYGSASVFQSSDESMDAIEIQVGVVGPSARGREVMFFFHDLFGNTKPQGWDNQLSDEFGLVFAYEHKWRYIFKAFVAKGDLEFIPLAGFALGNVHTYGNAGGQIRFGWNLPKDFGVSLIRPAGESNVPFIKSGPADTSSGWRFYVHGLIDTRLVLRNIFLDGNTFTESHRVAKQSLVADMSLGLALQYRRFAFSYAYTLRTKEFIAQPQPHLFASLAFACWF